MSEFAKDIVATLSPEKREWLLQRLKEKKGTVLLAGIPSRKSASDTFPLSFAQQRLWFLDRLEPESSTYTLPAALRMSGLFSVVALEKSLQQIALRHESLRTIFVSQQGTPMQVIFPVSALWMPLIDLRGVRPSVQEQYVRHLAQQQVGHPFDLAQGPLLRVQLLRLGDEEHIFLFNMHHIIADGWSIDVLVRELAMLYKAAVKGEEVVLPPLPVQYADYALWQREQLQGDFLHELLAYWQQQLAGIPTILNLPTDRPRPQLQTFVGGQESLLLPLTLYQELSALSQREGVTLFMTVLASLQCLLMRYSGQHDIVIGTPVANRMQKDLEGLIGFFVNTLVMRGDLSGDPSFQQLLTQVREMTLQAYAHQALPFEQLVSSLPIERSLSYSPFFQVLFVLQNMPQTELSLEALTLQKVEFEHKTSKFDLTFEVQEMAQGLLLEVEYNADLFEAGTIRRLLHHFQVLLEGIVADPEQHLSALPLLTSAEYEQASCGRAVALASYPQERCLHEMFEKQVGQAPDALAVVFEEEQLTYAELNSRANQLAHYLRKQGVGPEVLVGLCLERSVGLIVGILGILKAGGAYVPLDPAYPADRMAFMLNDAHISMLLTQQALIESIPVQGVQVLCLDTNWPLIAREPQHNVAGVSIVEQLAYVIYTSGSTGVPKGAMITHANVARLFAAAQGSFHFDSQDNWTFFHSAAFDFSVWELWGALLYGGRLVVVSYAVSRAPESFATLLVTHAVTVLNQTPSAFRQLVQVKSKMLQEKRFALRWIIFGGEALDASSVQLWFERYGELEPQLVNMYGITETTVHVTLRFLHREDVQSATRSLIGRPLADLQVYILDQYRHPVPGGVPGEMYIGGAGLARGYLNRPDLTSERFIAQLFNGQNSGRLYRTGDLARFLPTGELEYLGRIDQQVKLRGFRIELGEIETWLRLHPDLQACVVNVREDTPGDRRLVAYIVAHQGLSPTSGELRHYLLTKLPEYMVPSVFVQLEALPLTPNGKVDQRALPEPDQSRPELKEAYISPQTSIEELLAEIWVSVLGVEKVGIYDNFFDLGGHSLSMVKVFERLKETQKSNLTLLDLFKYPSIATLARFLNPQEYVSQAYSALTGDAMQPPLHTRVQQNTTDIAIIGMAGRFPKAQDVQEFWHNLQDGVEAVSFFSDEELQRAGIDPQVFNQPNFVRAGAVIDDIDLFDAAFFAYTPREAEIIDPQQRLFLECAWQALEDAGYNPVTYTGEIGIYAGVSMNSYLISNLIRNQATVNTMGTSQLLVSSGADFLTTRVSYKLNLRGPSVTVQTACSTSLVAVHMACESLRSGECDMVLAGGVSVRVPQKTGYLYEEGSILSPDGHCRAFDATAQGTIGGEGLGVVLLKPLEKAQADGDFIYAVIKGSAMNNDGNAKVGYTAPSVQGQAHVIAKALAMAKIEPEMISYIETHGTGTPIGDPIEVAALRQVYGSHGDAKYCAIGSLKTNIGHLDAASGIAGLLKTVLALHHEKLPPSLYFKEANPALSLADSPFFVNTDVRSWARNGVPRRAGVSSFGIGGTNAHVILEEAPPVLEPVTPTHSPSQLVVLSARSKPALDQARSNLVRSLRQHKSLELAHVAYTLQVGRQAFEHRLAVVCSDLNDAIQVLDEPLSPRIEYALTAKHHPKLVFLFSGQGTQYVEMGKELYQTEPIFRATIDTCAELLEPHLHLDIRTYLYPAPECVADCTEQLQQTWLTQPALFITEYALARLWMERGVYPEAMLGHSIGEYVAACLAGVFSLADALLVVALRGRLIQEMEAGAMVMVALPEIEVQAYLHGDFRELSLAAHNGETNCVLSGPLDAVKRLEEHLKTREVFSRRLHTSHAFHSQMMHPILERFQIQVQGVTLNQPRLAYISNLTGTWITPQQATDPGYWVAHLRQTVRFAEGLHVLLQDRLFVLLEVGPGHTLTTLAQRHPTRSDKQLVFSSMRSPQGQQSDRAFLLTTCGQLWCAGVMLNWEAIHTDEWRRRIPLPTYPFERKRYWIAPDKVAEQSALVSLARQEEAQTEDQADADEDTVSYHRPALSTAYSAPRGALERQIAEIWQELLGTHQIGIYDNFFELNGDSLLATQVVAHIRKALHIEISLRSLFETPTIAGMARQIEQAQTNEQKRALPELSAVPRTQALPLSFAQQRLWFLNQLEPGNLAYNIFAAARLSGSLDVQKLRWCFIKVVQRHEALRSTFHIQADEPVQIIGTTSESLAFLQEDLRRLPAQQAQLQVQRQVQEETALPFDLEYGPLLRIKLLQLEREEHILLFSIHHIIFDGWSMEIFLREVTALYTAFVTGRPATLPALPLQYGDFALWQRQWLKGDILEKQLNYWREQLAELEPLSLPVDRPRPVRPTFNGSQQTLFLPLSLRDDLRVLSLREGVTLFMTLLAAFQILLARYSNQDDIAVGTPIANRTHSEMKGLIGFFVNTLVLRTDLAGNPSFVEVLRQVREVALGAYAHQDVPFEQIVRSVQPQRDLSRNPLFQVQFLLGDVFSESIAEGATGFPGLTLHPLEEERTSVQFDLTLLMEGTEEGLKGTIRYSTDLFEADTIRRMLVHFQRLLESIVAHPEQRISQLSVLTEAQRRQILEEWNTVQPDFVKPLFFHQLFEAQVERTPDAVALTLSDQALSYKVLNQRANQLAHHLRSQGVGPEVLVGLLLERSFDLITAVLAIFKAGGAYLPLDPALPDERLAFELQDAQPHLIVTRQIFASRPLPFMGRPLILEHEARQIIQQSVISPACMLWAEQLAYMIYTSGSTGAPKGVLVSHRGLLNLAQQQIAAFEVEVGNRVLQFAPSSFDASISEMMMALLSGATLCLCEAEHARVGMDLYDLLEQQMIMTLTLPPSALQTLPQRELPSLQSLIVAGEACPLHLVEQWAPGRRFYNAYGPTEGTVCAALWRWVPRETRQPLPIGRPLAHTQCYVLDVHLQPVPIGVIGELYIGGIGLAQGYHRRADLTAERFIAHPFSHIPGERLYRTGDLVRYLSDGSLEYVGRNDYQVKVRGYRIEPGEIEARLNQHPGVQECLVLAQEDPHGDKRLIGYVVARQEPTLTRTELRDFVQECLPSYMVPSLFVILAAFPLKPNGKIDRQALPLPEEVRSDLQPAINEPQTALELFLAEVWQDVLVVESIGVHDSFFDLGGESIIGAILINKLQEKLDITLYVVTIFDAPTISKMASHLTEHYPEAIERLFGVQPSLQSNSAMTQVQPVTAQTVAQFRSLIPALPPSLADERTIPRNKKALFVLSPPRSGSTLFRVMLGGHPQLFAPPELELLSFNTLQDRREAFSGRDSFWLEGTIRTLMEIKGWDADTAKHAMEMYEEQHMTTREFYGLIQRWIGERVLVDKTPAYSLDIEILKRTEIDFANAHYIHLIRHPYGMIRSFEEAKSDLGFFRYEYSASPRELAELIWVVCQQNILEFLRQIPVERQYAIQFEDLVKNPEKTLKQMCRFLDVEFRPDMMKPYKKDGRMTDGIHPLARMLGDVKFHTHKDIDANVADRWKEAYAEDFLGEITWQMSETLGYTRPASPVKDPETIPLAENRLLPIMPRSAEQGNDLPLSFAQQRLWLLDQLEPGSNAYTLPGIVRLRGRLELALLGQALAAVLQRHESLRTTFPNQHGEPVQRIASEPTTHLITIDLSTLAIQEREHVATAIAEQEARWPFDLTQGPLLRCWLLLFDAQDQVLLLTMHHIISDGWSMPVLVRELTILYTTLKQGEEAVLAELPVQYADYALWQRQWLQGAILQEQLDYWKRQLVNLPLLELPIDHPRPRMQSFRGARQSLRLPSRLNQQLNTLSQRKSVTLFMTLLAAFQVLFSRYSGQSNIAIGTPVANRTRKEIEGLIGFFVNTLVLRTDLSGDPTFTQVLERVRQVALGAYSHQDVPFEQVVDVVQPERDLSRSPLFQVMLSLQQRGEALQSLPGVIVEQVEQENFSAKFDLEMTIFEDEQALFCAVDYNIDLFVESTIQRLLQHWQTLLESIVVDPEQHLSALTLLTPAERHYLLIDCNQTAQDYSQPLHYSLHFAQQAARMPERIAVCYQQEYLTYGAVLSQVQRLAAHLRQQNVGPETLVGIYQERSPWFLISLLAIWQCGGAYLPLDPAYPQERLALILAHAQVPLVLTTSVLRKGLPQTTATLLDLETLQEQPPLMDEPTSLATLLPQYLAYVIYTSGSTGVPKGVMVTHEGMFNHLWAKVTALELSTNDAVAQTASQCFDISVWQFLAPLLRGGQIHILPDIIAHDPFSLLQSIQHNAISILQVVPSLLGSLLDEMALHPQQGIRWLIVTGEAMPVHLWRRCRQEQRGIHLMNAYGPTECSDDVTHAFLTELEEGENLWRVPIGRPLVNTQLYLLDAHLEPVPLGVVGDIYVGGLGVGRGYLAEPARTAEVFVPALYGSEAGRRLYRTGDRGRYRADGQLEFVERQDAQVKLRGYRIELGEIETVLDAHPGVKQSVVLLQGEESHMQQLIAYVITEEGSHTLQSRGLRTFLKGKLPDYMLPTHFVMLSDLPLTPNGKVDRRRLPSLNGQQIQLQEQDRARSLFNPLEELVQQVYQEVLKRDLIGLHENFFEIGGHSLLATQVVARLRGLLSREVPLRLLFEAPTISSLATRLLQMTEQDQDLEMPPILPISRAQDLPLSFAQQRLWFLHRFDAENVAYTIPGAVRLLGMLNRGALRKSLDGLMQRHESLRTTFEERDGQPIQHIEQRADFPLLYIDLRNCERQRRTDLEHDLLRQATFRPFDLSRGPLCWAVLLHLDEQEYVLQLLMHHIISDGWSMDILVRELSNLYQAHAIGEPASLAPLPIQYADYALWQRQWLQGNVLSEHVRYWTRQLSEAHALELPGDHPRSKVFSYRGAGYAFYLDSELVQGIERLSRQEGVTLFMTLLAGWQVLLARLSGQEDIVVGTDSANRSHLETEGLIGFFINVLALRTHVNGNLQFINLLRDVREMVLGAYMHQALPFEMIVEHLYLERDGKRTPLINILFVMQNVPATEIELPGLVMKPVENSTNSVKFDLALFVTEEPAGLNCWVNYSTDMFEEETVARMMKGYEALLRDIVVHPRSSINDLEIDSREEKQLRITQKRNRLDLHFSKLKDFKGDRVDLS